MFLVVKVVGGCSRPEVARVEERAGADGGSREAEAAASAAWGCLGPAVVDWHRRAPSGVGAAVRE